MTFAYRLLLAEKWFVSSTVRLISVLYPATMKFPADYPDQILTVGSWIIENSLEGRWCL